MQTQTEEQRHQRVALLAALSVENVVGDPAIILPTNMMTLMSINPETVALREIRSKAPTPSIDTTVASSSKLVKHHFWGARSSPSSSGYEPSVHDVLDEDRYRTRPRKLLFLTFCECLLSRFQSHTKNTPTINCVQPTNKWVQAANQACKPQTRRASPQTRRARRVQATNQACKPQTRRASPQTRRARPQTRGAARKQG